MDDDETVIRPSRSVDINADNDLTVLPRPVTLDVSLFGETGELIARYSFKDRFTVGRASDNSVVIDSDLISRHHLEVRWENGFWWIDDLQSTNGVFLEGKRVQQKQHLTLPSAIAIGRSGIYLKVQGKNQTSSSLQPPVSLLPVDQTQKMKVSGPADPRQKLSQEQIKARLLAEQDAEDMGDYTLMVRRVIREDQTIRRKSYRKVIWILAGLFVVSVGLIAYQQIVLANTRKLAIDMFYDIKTLEVSISQADIKLETSAEALDEAMTAIQSEKLRAVQEQLKLEQEKIAAEKKRMRQERDRLASMKAKYRQYIEETNALRLRFPTSQQYEEELIAKVARELGESELELPDDFVGEVRNYIRYWQNSSRLQTAIVRMHNNNYLSIVVSALQQNGLSPYFIYLPLQESNFDHKAIGPETIHGIAKGAWQLLASTAEEYGVLPGPLAGLREYDEQDGRFDFMQSTQAAVKYLKRIYGKEAQASGLLVMASYNYGDNRVRGMIRNLQDNPRDKNFWKLLKAYELPKETRDYVFYIFSAAVIGEDPAHFGFKFHPPLSGVVASN